MSKNFQVGNTDPYISKIQQAINEKLGPVDASKMPGKAYLVSDGGFGPKTRDALMAFQKSVGLSASGTYDAATAAVLDPYIDQRFLSDEDFSGASQTLQIEEALIRAVTEVEGRGRGFLPDGRPLILFERHVFRQQLLKLMKASTATAVSVAKILGVGVPVTGPNIALLDDTMMSLHGDIYSEKLGGYIGGASEYKRLEKAAQFSLSAARSSASWGMFQIMGYHFATLGYGSVEEMVKLACVSETSHLKDFCKFVQADQKLITSLRGKDYLTFARTYNGPGQQGYDEKIRTAYQKFKN